MSEATTSSQNMTEDILRRWVQAAIMPTKITDVYKAEENVFYLHFSRMLDEIQIGMIRACGFGVEQSPRFAVGSYCLEWFYIPDDEL